MPKKEKPPPGPDDVVRESPGVYRSGDGRFAITQSDASWFVVDTEQANEFGQELIHGPFSSLKQATSALSGARNVKPLLRSTKRPKRPPKAAPARPPQPPPSWIDKLDEAQQRNVRRLIRALESEGLADAEELVRRHRDDPAPVIAQRVIEHRLRALIESRPEDERDSARELLGKVITLLAVDGRATTKPMPRWSLVGSDDDGTPGKPIQPRV